MSEVTKTFTYCIAALVSIGIGVLSIPRTTPPDAFIQETIGTNLFEFEDPAEAASLEIIEFDEALAQLSKFKVARDPSTNAWVIPSHSRYPADADNQMRDAALAMIDLKRLDVASRVASDHEIYGVVDPNDELKASAKGVGKLVIVKNKDNKTLAELIIGKMVKDAEGQRFVRVRGEDVTYVVEINPDQLPTEFGKWIEKDLLKISSFDVDSLSLRDYSVIRGAQGLGLQMRLQVDTDFDSTANKWELGAMNTFGSRGEPIPSNLLDEEELDTQKLNDLKTALDQLEIVDVARKPTGLGADLKASKEFMNNPENQDDLNRRGFYVVPLGPQRELTIVAANGEVHASTKSGVRYILRFGQTTGSADEKGQLNRYMFVTAELDSSKLPKPKLEPLPIGDTPVSMSDEEKKQVEENLKVGVVEGEPQKISDPDELVAARERITKENNRKVEEYKEKVADAEKEVSDLQARFGDWYYVVANDVYKKIRLGRADIIKEREGQQQGYGLDSFRSLEQGGLKGGPENAPPSGPGGLPGGLPPGLGGRIPGPM